MEKQANKSLYLVIAAIILIVIAILVVVLVKHKNTNNAGALTAAQKTAAEAEIKTNWKEFFAYSTTLQNREKLLQNGTQFAQPIQSEFAALSTQASSATISSVNVLNSTSANVVYTVDLNGQPVLSNQKGQALYIGKTWVVSDSTICGLLSMGGDKPSICQNY